MEDYTVVMNVCPEDLEIRDRPYHTDLLIFKDNRKVGVIRHSFDNLSYVQTKKIVLSLLDRRRSSNECIDFHESWVNILVQDGIFNFTCEHVFSSFHVQLILRVNNSLIEAYRNILIDYPEYDDDTDFNR